jgi:hypothetical protein
VILVVLDGVATRCFDQQGGSLSFFAIVQRQTGTAIGGVMPQVATSR